MDIAFREPYFEDYRDFEPYVPGGFCPLKLWDRFKHDEFSYTITYLLGIGSSSMVWLSRERDGRYCALKVLAADRTLRERDIMKSFSNKSSLRDNHYVAKLLNTFDYESANGVHCVLALPWSLHWSQVLHSRRKVNFRSLVKGLIIGLDGLHAADIVHGDIHADNVAFHGLLLTDEMVQNLPPPHCFPLPPNKRRPD